MRFSYIQIFCLLALVNQIHAWGGNGHMLVAQVAKIELLNKYPEIYKLANMHVESMGQLSGNNTDFVSSAVWPDQIRSKGMSFWAPWHFFGRPYDPDGLYLQQDQIGDEINSVDCLKKAKLELQKDTGKINLQKAVFIRFALHVVGDIHQPLHSTRMVNETYSTANGDYGGNLQKVYTVHGEEIKLHTFWDRGAQYIQKTWKPYSVPLSQEDKMTLESWAYELMERYPREFYEGKDKILDYDVWTKESFHHSVDITYPLIFKSNQLTQEYTDNAQEICRQRIVLAGYRLVEYLVDVLGDYVEQQQEEFPVRKFLE